MNGAAVTIAIERTTKFVLITTVNARPRTASGAPRWTSSTLITNAAPLPMPENAIAPAATQMFGETATTSVAAAISIRASG